jgi:hypothetical protein
MIIRLPGIEESASFDLRVSGLHDHRRDRRDLHHPADPCTHEAFGTGGRAAGKAPGPIGRLLAKPFWTSSKAAGKSADAGRKGRGKMPM